MVSPGSMGSRLTKALPLEVGVPILVVLVLGGAPELASMVESCLRSAELYRREEVAATGAGGRVQLTSSAEQGRLTVAVPDSGPGVAPDMSGRIWEPFFTTKQRGTGLGLAIVRKRIEEVGGQARLATSRPGEGARFELTLPLRKEVGQG